MHFLFILASLVTMPAFAKPAKSVPKKEPTLSEPVTKLREAFKTGHPPSLTDLGLNRERRCTIFFVQFDSTLASSYASNLLTFQQMEGVTMLLIKSWRNSADVVVLFDKTANGLESANVLFRTTEQGNLVGELTQSWQSDSGDLPRAISMPDRYGAAMFACPALVPDGNEKSLLDPLPVMPPTVF